MMSTHAGFSGMGDYSLSDAVIEFYERPFPPFGENGRPVNGFAYDDFKARINFSPSFLEGHRSSGDGEQGLA